MTLSERDRKFVWHPFTQEKTASLPIGIKRGEGSYLYDENDKAYLDLISSWWVNLHGHAHPEIARAIYQQALTLEHVIFAGFTHEPAVKLCELMSQTLPNSLSKFFFSDNGSTSVEIAIKMAYQYWMNKGEKDRNLFLSFDGGYHGDTFGAMSLGAKSGFHDTFSKLFFDVLSVPFPATWDDDDEVLEKEKAALETMEQHLADNRGKIAAIIMEPIIQGASGMRMCRVEFMRQVMQLAKSHGVLVIFDEVMTGFGRTGKTFAMDHIGMTPDFICLSKGITGGFLPLALTITTEEVYEAFLSDSASTAFAHGHSYTANPLACAASIASFGLLVNRVTGEAINAINQAHKEGISYLKKNCPNIQKTRVFGTIAAFEVCGDYEFDLTQFLKTKFLEQGLLIRPLGNVVYLLPPYSITTSELESVYLKLYEIINELRCLEPVFTVAF